MGLGRPGYGCGMSQQTAHMWRLAGRYGAIGMEMALCVAGSTAAGNWLDGRLGSSPWLLLLGFGIGSAAAGVSLRRLIGR